MLRSDLEFSTHALDMFQERNIPEEWVWQTISFPDRTEIGSDNNIHYIKAISEYEGRFLRIVVNPHQTPKRIVTFFFDRRIRRQ